MLGAAIITAALGRWVDSGVLRIAVLMNVVVSGHFRARHPVARSRSRRDVRDGGRARGLGHPEGFAGDHDRVHRTRGATLGLRRACVRCGGDGYAPVGAFSIDDRIVGVAPYPAISLAIAACIPLHIAYTHGDFVHGIFDSTALTLMAWSKVVAAGLLAFVVAELEKFFIRRSGLAARLSHA